ncbi:hypothetical protein BB8028_0001g03290 [Beauveria bassiana]|uniref:Uncharacterized protein n=1 Tax=Beauveria bassiana TaxID=176275 RepID=A0A2S7XWH2_BEABA|nr:hypothetical protein BB8028_0001g03290 [Beauveria bassiana]
MLLWPSRRRVFFSWPGGGPLVGDRRRVRGEEEEEDEDEEQQQQQPAGPDCARGPSRPTCRPVLVVRGLSGLSHSLSTAKLAPVVGLGVPCPAPSPPLLPPPPRSSIIASHHPPKSTMSDENLFCEPPAPSPSRGGSPRQ